MGGFANALALAPWSPEHRACALNIGSDHTVFRMVINQSHGLHEGIYRSWPDKFPA